MASTRDVRRKSPESGISLEGRDRQRCTEGEEN